MYHGEYGDLVYTAIKSLTQICAENPKEENKSRNLQSLHITNSSKK
jgi:hypothetical protein